MSKSISAERRTRSQLTLSDDILLQLPQGSPMKDARSARRHLTPDSGTSGLNYAREKSDNPSLYINPEDETTREHSMKRSMSPSTELSMDYHGSLEERESKRAKTDQQSQDTLMNNEQGGSTSHLISHGRNASDPNSTRRRRSTRQRSATPSGSDTRPAPPTEMHKDTPECTQSKGRAQSVPLFPTTYPSPFVDLRHPPPSPWRAQSRSPEKEEPKLRITFEYSKLDRSVEEGDEKIDAEEEAMPQDTHESHCGTLAPSYNVERPVSNSSEESITECAISRHPVEDQPMSDIPQVREVPSTPVSSYKSPLLSLSPLTPLPSTPNPPRYTHSPVDQVETASSLGGPSTLDVPTETIHAEMNNASHVNKAVFSILPTSITLQSQFNPHLQPIAVTGGPSLPYLSAAPKPDTSGPGRNALSVLGRKASTPSSMDAFSVLMQQATKGKGKSRETNVQDKGKQKVQPSMITLQSRSTTLDARPQISDSGLGKAHSRHTSIKDKMKSKTRSRVKVKPSFKVIPTFREAVPDAKTIPERFATGQLTTSKPAAIPDSFMRAPALDLSTALSLNPGSSSGDDTAISIKPASSEVLMSVDVAPQESDTSKSPEVAVTYPVGVGECAWAQQPAEEQNIETSLPPQRTEEQRSEVPPLPHPTQEKSTEIPLLPQPTQEHTHETLPLPQLPREHVNETSQLPLPMQEEKIETSPLSQPTQEGLETSLLRRPTREHSYETSPFPQATQEQNTKDFSLPPIKPPAEPRARSTRKRSLFLPVTRVTRSASSKLKTEETDNTHQSLALRSTTPALALKSESPLILPCNDTQAYATPSTNASLNSFAPSNDAALPPGLAMCTVSSVKKSVGSSYARPTTSSSAKVSRTPTKGAKPGLRSPPKHGRTLSTPARSFFRPSGSMAVGTTGNSLSNLSNALEKLYVPPPMRPNTTMGFHRQVEASDVSMVSAEGATQNGVQSNRTALGNGRPLSGMNTESRPSTQAAISTIPTRSSAQKPISMFLASKQRSAMSNPFQEPKMHGVSKAGIFGIGMRNRAPKVSRKTNLPMVIGSPVKGSKSNDIFDDHTDNCVGGSQPKPDNEQEQSIEIPMNSMSSADDLSIEEYSVSITGSPEDSEKEKGKSDSWKTSSRRASLASMALSRSLSAMPPQGAMGPPPTPPRFGQRVTRSVSGTLPSASWTAEKKKGKDKSNLGFMKDCVVFVDVRTDDGDDAGSLFVEMLRDAGAKILTRVGQTCTHIIFKNGLLSTMSRYRMLRDPKPFVVGIAWVVECVEQRKLVDETNFLVDLDVINVAGVNKRRKSFLPKLVTQTFNDGDTQEENHEGDESMEGSNSSLILDNDLPPLERARRRKSFLVGPRP
ncbi:hypothetical protein AMATHDRAFT_3512 [Amanita thiersii Skay4041]|uniref:BRCT domain-containing protein n=1 Tax=Amanita thiersii Skay4041 TaxID=703135 RepID=A0A2A9NJW9_9AGAR|nr:hypothetical protein AMATHDRAFT_3512 [Amanita thiersii Skay4041]